MDNLPIYPQKQDQQKDQPTIGQQIMNRASTDTASTATQPVIGALPGAGSYNQAAIGPIVASMTDSGRQWLDNQMQQESKANQEANKPLNPGDRKYRMGIGQRILGSLVNFGNGFSGGRLPTVHVGPGAVNSRYYQDERQRQNDAAASDARLESLQSAKQNTAQLHDQLMNSRSDTNQQETPASADEFVQAAQQSPLTLYERSVMQAAQEGDPAKAAEWDRALKMTERLQQHRENAPTATNGLTPDEMKLYNNQAYGLNQRIAALEKAERTPEIDAYLQKLNQQRDTIANNIQSHRSGPSLQRKPQGRWNARTGRWE
ncbi:MAG TPA: hypothetical protein VG759_27005 [Candidatus Angelobacter sp.]|nr:hypothetical protein [Candidatus Angelobacter sp.]